MPATSAFLVFFHTGACLTANICSPPSYPPYPPTTEVGKALPQPHRGALATGAAVAGVGGWSLLRQGAGLLLLPVVSCGLEESTSHSWIVVNAGSYSWVSL